MGVGSFSLAGGFGVDAKEGDGSDGTLAEFVNNTAPEMKASGVDWTSDGTVSASSTPTHTATTQATVTAGHDTQSETSNDLNLSLSGYDANGNSDGSSDGADSSAAGGGYDPIIAQTTTSPVTSATSNTTNHPTINANNDHTAVSATSSEDDAWAAWDTENSDGAEAVATTTSTATPTATTTGFTRSPFASPAHDEITQQHPGDPALVTSYSAGAPTAALDTANAVHETFDNGAGMMPNVWGDVQEGNGYIDVTSPASDHSPAGVMVAPTGADAGMGYGHYAFTLSTNTTNVGPYAALWPSTDVWPGPEIDVFELGPNGDSPFDTVHWNDNGNDGFDWAQMPSGIDPTQPHTYAVDWQDGSMTFSVDSQNTRTVTQNIPKDFAHGGENLSPGVGVLTHNFDPGLNPVDNTLTLYDFTYTPHTDTVFA
jgi:hypothetical protein